MNYTTMPLSELDRLKHEVAAQARVITALTVRAEKAERAEAAVSLELDRCRRRLKGAFARAAAVAWEKSKSGCTHDQIAKAIRDSERAHPSEPEPAAPPLDEEVCRLLRWLDENPCTHAAWLTNGKPAKGGPEKWNQHQCSGANGSIIVSAETWFAAKDYFEVNPSLRPSIWQLSEAGRALLGGE